MHGLPANALPVNVPMCEAWKAMLTAVGPMCCQPSRVLRVGRAYLRAADVSEFLYTSRWSCCTDDLLHR